MESSSLHSAPVELDAGDLPLVLPLATHPTPFRPGPERREVFVRRQAWSSKSKVLVIIEKGVAPDGTTYESTRYLDLLQDLVLPLYALSRYNRTEWNIEVGYGQGLDRVDYPFRTQQSAWRFQQLLTGYQPVEMFDDITCVVTYWALRLPLPQYKGMGQIQMWVEVEDEYTTPGCQVWDTSSLSPVSSSTSSGSSRSTARPMSMTSIQSRSTFVQTQTHLDKSVLVVQEPRPPLLVAFLKDKAGNEEYSMLKINVMDLTVTEATSQREEALLSVTASEPFPVQRHLPSLPGPNRLSAWSICERTSRSTSKKKRSKVEELNCTKLALNFGSYKDPLNMMKRKEVYDSILRLQVGHLERLEDLKKVRNGELAERAKEMRMQMSQLRVPISSSGSSRASTPYGASVRNSNSPIGFSAGIPRSSTSELPGDSVRSSFQYYGTATNLNGYYNSNLSRVLLPEVAAQAAISTTFINAPYESREFGRAAITPELENDSAVSSPSGSSYTQRERDPRWR